MRFNCSLETASASVLPKNIISIPKNDSNLGWRVIFAKTQPIAPINFGRILKYIKISNNGTTNKIGNSALTAISICLLETKLLNANPVPAFADSITQEIPFAAALIPDFPHGK